MEPQPMSRLVFHKIKITNAISHHKYQEVTRRADAGTPERRVCRFVSLPLTGEYSSGRLLLQPGLHADPAIPSRSYEISA